MPNATLVTGTVTLVAFGAIVTVAGTVATVGVVELRVTTRPAGGAGADSVSVRFWVAIPVIVALEGKKLSVAFTTTDALVEVYPGADAVIFAVPKLIPLSSGCVLGVICPAGMKTLVGLTDRMLVSELASVIVTPLPGAAAGNAI